MADKKQKPQQPRSFRLPPDWLHERLKELKIERKALSHHVGVSLRRITDWINGEGIRTRHLRKIYDLLGSLPNNLEHLILPGGQSPSASAAGGTSPFITEFFTLCGRGTDFLVIDGDGVTPYPSVNVQCRVDPTPPSLPPEVQEFRQAIEKEQYRNRENGRNAHWNGPLFALTNFTIFRSDTLELPGVTFTFARSDYFTFLATVKSLDKSIAKGKTQITLRELYVPVGEHFATPVPFMAQGFGVVLVIVTRDGHVLLHNRANSLGARAHELDVSVVETVHPEKDGAVTGVVPDLYRAAVRGCVEEAGVEVGAGDIRFLGFGVDRQYYQWNMLGCVRTELTAKEILERRCRGIPGKWESKSYQAVPFEPCKLFHFLRSESMWSTAWCALYWSLINYGYSPSQVRQAAENVL